MDAANVAACFAVVMLHCSNIVFANTGDFQWHRAVIVQSTFIFAVPFFLMISGANLLGYRKRYTTIEFFKKRASRILGVFFGCSVLFYLVSGLFPLQFGYEPHAMSLGDFIYSFLTNNINDVYWYFYAIIALYLVTPVFSLLAERHSTLRYALIICIVMSICFPFVERIAPWPHALASFYVPYLSSWLTYYLLGYYLVHCFNRRINSGLLIAVFVASVAASSFLTFHTNETALLVDPAAPYDNYYAGVFGPFEFIGICSLFLLFKQSDKLFSKARLPVILRSLSALSLGIYAIHMLWLRLFETTVPALEGSLILLPIVVFLLSALTVWSFRLVVKLCRRSNNTRMTPL